MHPSNPNQKELVDSLFCIESFEAVYHTHLEKKTDHKTSRAKVFKGYEGIRLKSFRKHRQQLFLSTIRKFHQRRFTFNPYSLTYIPKKDGGERPISRCGLRDYIVQNLTGKFLNKIFDDSFLDSCFAYREEKGPKQATIAVRSYIKQGFEYFLVGDIKEFFDKLDHEILLNIVKRHIKDERILTVIYRYIKTPSVSKDDFENARDRSKYPSRKEGIPQGGALSGILSNIYLLEFDRIIQAVYPAYCRYADNFLIAAHSQQAAEDALTLISKELRALRLEAHPAPKTSIVSINDRFDFLGFHHGADKLTPAETSIRSLKNKIANIYRKFIPSLDWEHDLERIIWTTNNIIVGQNNRSWGAYYCLSSDIGVFKRLDKWISTQLIHAMLMKHGKRIKYSQLKGKGLKSMTNGYYRKFQYK